MIESDPLGFALALAGMTLTVYLSRAGGYWLIGRVTIGPRLRRILDALPGAVIAASVAPIVVHGGLRAGAAILAAAVVMFPVWHPSSSAHWYCSIRRARRSSSRCPSRWWSGPGS
jgi:uncharacterized membrane protein